MTEVYYEDAKTITVADDATYTFSVGSEVVVYADKVFEYNFGGTVFFPLLASTSYLLSNRRGLQIHAPSGGGTVTLSVMVGGK